ncbi:glycosyltransferase [Pedobacter nyackensis]|uniref:glycosyltransferase n=1 Tax=Pedobacter nyackensis TaxID=475255 RepID=UPI00292CB9FD|nr:glycosyltransferase [Pedobacter nyackensis]
MESNSDKLLFVSMSDTVGGAENILCMVAAETGSPIIFLKHIKKSRLFVPGWLKVSYLTNGLMLIGFLKLIKALYHYRKDYTIISTHPYLNSYLGMLKRIGYIKSDLLVRECTSVFTRYKGVKKWTYQIAYKLGYPAVNLIICQTDIMKNQLLEQNKFIPEYKVLTKGNPVNLNHILKKAEEPLNEKIVNSDFICSAGRLITEKGFSILINAFANIALQHSNLKLLILGEGTERRNLNNLIKDIGLEERVILMGHIDNPIPYFKKAKLCVVSSVREGFPNVLLEMMAVSASSVVSTLCAGGIEAIPDIIKVKANNVHALTEAINSVLCDNSKNNVIEDYFKDRTPKNYINSILREANRLRPKCTDATLTVVDSY